jgi:hypothetical protein
MNNFLNKDEVLLNMFYDRACELLDNPIVNDKKTIVLKHESVFDERNETFETSVKFDGFDRHYFQSFIMTFRQFFMPTEVINFKKICNIILDHCRGQTKLSDHVNHVTYAIAKWDTFIDNKLHLGAHISFQLGGKTYDNDKLLRLWLYSGKFHSDVRKTKLWNSLPEPIQKEMEYTIHQLVPKLVNCIVIVANVIHAFRNPLYKLPDLPNT